MKKGLILALSLMFVFLAGCDLKKPLSENKPADNNQPIACSAEAKVCPDGSSVGRTGTNCEFSPCPNIINKDQSGDFVFTQDYKVEQADYSKGGDWPTGEKITIFKKGDIVSGKYSLNGCQEEGCVPVKVVVINVNGQNWPVDTSILQPLPSPGDLKVPVCPVGQKFFNEQCVCPSPWNVRIGSLKDGYQCAGMPKDDLK